jgi:hypothetical protein
VCGSCELNGGGRTCFCTGVTDPPVAADGSYAADAAVALSFAGSAD